VGGCTDGEKRGGPDGGHFVHGEGGSVVIDDEDACATVIAEVTYRLLITPCPGFCRGDPYHGGGSGSRGPPKCLIVLCLQHELRRAADEPGELWSIEYQLLKKNCMKVVE
jgi:hypothetical protein